jgi:hypothetical protein
MNMNLSFAMQQFIMLMHIQMQQIIHEFAPPTCVLIFNPFPMSFSPPYNIFLSLCNLTFYLCDFSILVTFLSLWLFYPCDFSLFVTFLSPFVNNHQKGANFSESQVNQYEGVQIIVQYRSLA